MQDELLLMESEGFIYLCLSFRVFHEVRRDSPYNSQTLSRRQVLIPVALLNQMRGLRGVGTVWVFTLTGRIPERLYIPQCIGQSLTPKILLPKYP